VILARGPEVTRERSQSAPAKEPAHRRWVIFGDRQDLGEKAGGAPESRWTSDLNWCPAHPSQSPEADSRSNPEGPPGARSSRICGPPKNDPEPIEGVINFRGGGPRHRTQEPGGRHRGFGSIRHGLLRFIWFKHWLRMKKSASARLWLVTRGGSTCRAMRIHPHWSQSPLWGLGRTVMLEHPNSNARFWICLEMRMNRDVKRF